MATEARPRVLIVEDEPDMNHLLADVLSAYGFEPIPAATGQEALTILAEQTPDAILLDLMLPDLNGFELCHQLKTSRTTRKIPVVILTALDRPADRRDGYKTGAADYVTKPFTPEGLVARLRACLEHCCAVQAVQKECSHLVLTADLSASINDLKVFNTLTTCLYCMTDLVPDQMEALRRGLISLSDAAGHWAADHRSLAPVQLTIDLTPTRLRLQFQPTSKESEGFLAEHLHPEAAVPSEFTDAGVIDRLMEEAGGVVLEKRLRPPAE